jgi:hypothetical protein
MTFAAVKHRNPTVSPALDADLVSRPHISQGCADIMTLPALCSLEAVMSQDATLG